MSQCINNSAESRISRAPARGAPRQTASAVRRCIIKRNYSSLPLINRVQLPRAAAATARHGEHSRPCQQSGCCSRGPSVCPPTLPAPAAGGSSELALPCHGGTARWASWCGKTRLSAGLAEAGKHLICCLGIPPTETRAKGAGWGASPWYPASSQLPKLGYFGACILLGVCECYMGHPPRNSLQPQEPHNSDRDSEMHGSVTPRGGFSGDMGGIGPAKGALFPRGKWPWWQQPGRLSTTAVPWQGHSTWDLPGGKLILGVLRRGYFGPFALCESPAIFQPQWGYFRGRVICTDWDNAAGTLLGSWSPKQCWEHNPLPKLGAERSPGSQQLLQ